ncbi:MAG TPA: ABC transporter permease [Candidatus Aquilonibacter sp.]|nr:ABC transporter permease [Candidatus Aquilonibacter sp.]
MRYVTRRLFHAAFLLVGVSFLSFALLQWAPGDFFDELRLNPRISARTIEGLRAEYGLNESLPVRYERWLLSIAKGDLGFSIAYNSPVGPLLIVRARNTLVLTGAATIIAWTLAIPVGVWSAVSRGWPSRAIGFATSTLLTIPDLLLFLCLLLLAVRTGWFPVGGMFSPRAADTVGIAAFWPSAEDLAAHLILPAAGLALVALPVLIRHVRSAMLDVLGSPFLRAARGHGISRSRLLFRYAFPVAANPLISLIGFSIATMLSGSLVAEVVLSWPGLGPLLIEATLSRDVYVVVAIVLLSAVFLVLGMLVSDLLLFAADPRIRQE